MTKNVVFFGCRGYSNGYGGWETLVQNLINHSNAYDTNFYVFEVVNSKKDEGIFKVNNVTCIRVYVSTNSHFQMIIYDYKCFKKLKSISKKFNFEKAVLYIMGARIGMLMALYKNRLKKFGYILVHNPAGLEWKRESNPIIKKYVYYSHKFLAKSCDYLCCDCYEMQRVYEKMCPSLIGKISFIYYGASDYSIYKNDNLTPKSIEYFNKYRITPYNYYLIINRFVSENSYELILREFVNSSTDARLVIISNINYENKLYKKLAKRIPFEKDNRIVFAGTLYDKDVLADLRRFARGYINGHTLGGTNPGLLEALASTDVNIVRDCSFSREGAGDCPIYFDETKDSFCNAIAMVDAMSCEDRKHFGIIAKERVNKMFLWEKIAKEYDALFAKIIESKEK